MPIGNGQVVLNVWVEQATGDLLFYIARTDSLSEISRILKLARVRIHLDPAPLKGAGDFLQLLALRQGRVEIAGGGAHLTLFVDSGADVVRLKGKFAEPVNVTATVECWRNEPREIPKAEQGSAWSVHDAPFKLIESADVFTSGGNAVTWYHRNETSVVPKLWENQSLTGLPGTFDPLIHRTFGGALAGPGLQKRGDRQLATAAPVHEIELRVATHAAQTGTVGEWLAGLPKGTDIGFEEAEARTARWWESFWNRSWVFVQGAPAVTRGYALQRYVQAVQGRGTYPIKFNGGYYTVEPKAMGSDYSPDWRAWGDSHWYQNVRHMYHPMTASGDFEMMEPFFNLYEAARKLAESRTKLYHGCEGAYFPETMTAYGTYSGGDYGWDRTGKQPKDVGCPYWQFAWNQGLELVALMLDRWDYTRDEAFLKRRTLPMAESVLRYFDTRFKKDAQGRVVLDPTQAVETYWHGVVNDMPSTAGLIAVTRRLCELPVRLVDAKRRAFFEHMKAACPELPLEQRDGQTELAPAQKFDKTTSNCENPELYGVWPFRVVCLAHPQLLQEAKRAYEHRNNHLDVGWGYDGNAAALLGMTDEAARILSVKCANSNPAYRWPATWGPNFDWLPDQNHGGNLLETADLMLLQGDPIEEGGAIRLLPAWPKAWDVDFKLHAPGNTVVECTVKSGRVVRLQVAPASRRKDVVLPEGWALEPGAAR
jgi:hypothetical protein